MASNDLFAPPTKDELAALPAKGSTADMFAPPTKDELALGQPQQSNPNEPTGVIGKAIHAAAQPNHMGMLSPMMKGIDLIYNGGGGQAIGKAMDYPGGIVRTAAANLAGTLSGKDDAVTAQDQLNTLKGNAPSSEEYMKRLGVPDGPSATIPIINKNVSARGVGGFLGDIATNPLTYAGGALEEVPGLGGLMNAGKDAAEDVGKYTYKSGFKKIDERLAEKGKTPVSDVLLENGAPTGTTKDLAGNMGDIAEDVSNQRSAAYQKADQLAGPLDLKNLSFQKAEAQIAKLRQSRFSADKALAEDLANHLDELKSAPANMQELSDIKSDTYDLLPDSAFSGGKIKNKAAQFQKNLGSDIKQAIIDHGNKAEPGLGDTIDDLNDTWGSLISAEKPTAMQIRRGETTNAVTPVDAIVGMLNPHVEMAKKAADLAKTTWARTNVGKGLIDLSQSGTIDPTLRQGLIDYEKSKNARP